MRAMLYYGGGLEHGSLDTGENAWPSASPEGPAPPPPPRPSGILDEDPPDCSQPQTGIEQRAYCSASPPTGVWLERTRQAIERIAGRGGECANIARAARVLLDAGRLRYYASFAGVRGGYGHPDWGALLLDEWVEHWHAEPAIQLDDLERVIRRNLDEVITHETEHAMGRLFHIDEAAGGFRTTHSEACSGL